MRITAVKILIVVNVIVFLFTNFVDTATMYNSEPFGSQYCCSGDYGGCDWCEYETCCEYTYTDYNFALIPYGVFEKPWILITSMFLHIDWLHIILNMIGLVLFGIYLERVVGWKNFLLIYFIGGIGAGLIYIPFAIHFGAIYIPVVGASGAIYAVILTLMIIRPYDEIFKLRGHGFWYDAFRAFPLWFEGYIPLGIVGMFYLVLALHGLFIDFLMGQSGVANAAHLGGAVVGMVLGFYFRSNYKDDDSERRSTYSEQMDEYFEGRARRYEDAERQRQIAREEGARAVIRNRHGEYEIAGGESDEDELEIEEERKIKKDSDDELEIL